MTKRDVGRAAHLLKESDLFQSAGSRSVKRVAEIARFQEYRRGGPAVWTAGANDNLMLIVADGVLAGVRGEQFVATFGVGRLLGLSSLFGEPHSTTLVASTPSAEVLIIPAAALERVLRTDGDAAVAFLRAVYGQLRERDAELTEFRTRKDAAQRLALFILRRTTPSSREIFARRGELAAAIGCEPATVSRLTKRWRSDGLIFKTNETIQVLDRPRLERVAKGLG
jgi:CRP-like cAMP-binding protein